MTSTPAYVAPLLCDGDPFSAEGLQEFFEAVQALDAATRVQAYHAACTADLTMSSASIQAVVGATVSFSTTGVHSFAVIWSVFDIANTAGAVDFNGYTYADGAALDALVVKYCGTADRSTLMQVIPTPVPPGAHTIDLRGAKTVNTATLTAKAAHTTVTVLVVDLP